jgi:hypothetical protein
MFALTEIKGFSRKYSLSVLEDAKSTMDSPCKLSHSQKNPASASSGFVIVT